MSENTKYIFRKNRRYAVCFINTEFDESYHSIIKAYKEALHKHVLACKIDELTKDF